MNRRAKLTAAVAVALAVGASCSDGGDDTASRRLTRAAFVAEADTACTKAKERIAQNTEAIPADLRSVDPYDADAPADARRRLAPFTANLGRIYQGLRTDLARFEPPEADAPRIEAILADLGQGAQRFLVTAESFEAGTLADGEAPIPAIAAPSRELVEYGAGECAPSGN